MPRGGYRPGAGRRKGPGKSKAPITAADTPKTQPDAPLMELTPLDYLLRVMNDPLAQPERRDRAALAAANFMHHKAGDAGKKIARQDAADRVSKGKFSPAAPPKLVVNNR